MLQAGLKIVAAHAFFVRCKTSLPPSNVVIFLDGSDTVLERTTHTAQRAHSGPPSTQWPTERLAPRALGPASNASAVPAQVLQLPAAEVVSRYRAFHRGQLVVSTELGTFWASDEGCLPPSTRKLEHAPARASPAGPPAWTPRPRAA